MAYTPCQVLVVVTCFYHFTNFLKIQAGEKVDMPVFFYVDPKILTDRQMKNVRSITLSYTFFRSASDDDDVNEALEELEKARQESAKAQPAADTD